MDHGSKQHAELCGVVVSTDETVDNLTATFGTIGATAYPLFMGIVAAGA
jgi:hypothetical protein